MRRHRKALARLKAKIARTDFAEEKRNERKGTWLRICHRFVKGLKSDLEPLFKKHRAAHRARRAAHARRQKILAARHRVQARRARVRALAERMANRTQGQLSVPVKKVVWTTYRQRRLALRPPFRRMKSTADPATTAAKAERLRAEQQKREQAAKNRQEIRELRSRKRMRLVLRQQEWLRRGDERERAGDDLWAEMEGSGGGAGVQESSLAWPDLRRKQSRRLAGVVEAFVRGGR